MPKYSAMISREGNFTFTREELERLQKTQQLLEQKHLNAEQLRTMHDYFNEYANRYENSTEPEKRRKADLAKKLVAEFAPDSQLVKVVTGLSSVGREADRLLKEYPDKQIFTSADGIYERGDNDKLVNEAIDVNDAVYQLFGEESNHDNPELSSMNRLSNLVRDFNEADDFAEYAKDAAGEQTNVVSLKAEEMLTDVLSGAQNLSGVISAQDYRLLQDYKNNGLLEGTEKSFVNKEIKELGFYLDDNMSITRIRQQMQQLNQEIDDHTEEYNHILLEADQAQSAVISMKAEENQLKKKLDSLQKEYEQLQSDEQAAVQIRQNEINNLKEAFNSIGEAFDRGQKAASSPAKVEADALADLEQKKIACRQIADVADVSTVVDTLIDVNLSPETKKEKKPGLEAYVHAKVFEQKWRKTYQVFQAYALTVGADEAAMGYLFADPEGEEQALNQLKESYKKANGNNNPNVEQEAQDVATYARQAKERMKALCPAELFGSKTDAKIKQDLGEYLKAQTEVAARQTEKTSPRMDQYLSKLRQYTREINDFEEKNKDVLKQREINVQSSNKMREELERLKKEEPQNTESIKQLQEIVDQYEQSFYDDKERAQEKYQTELLRLQSKLAEYSSHMTKRGISSPKEAVRLEQLIDDLAEGNDKKLAEKQKELAEAQKKVQKAAEALAKYKQKLALLEQYPEIAQSEHYKKIKELMLSPNPSYQGIPEQLKDQLAESVTKVVDKLEKEGPQKLESFKNGKLLTAQQAYKQACDKTKEAEKNFREKETGVAEALMKKKALQKRQEGLAFRETKLKETYEKYNSSKNLNEMLYKVSYEGCRRELAAGDQAFNVLFDRIQHFKDGFNKALKSSYRTDTDRKNSDEYKAIKEQLDQFGSREELGRLTPQQIQEKLQNLKTAADQYKTAKMHQKLHIFPSSQRKYRLRYADGISEFCQREMETVFTNSQRGHWLESENTVKEVKDYYKIAGNLQYEHPEAEIEKELKKVSEHMSENRSLDQDQELMPYTVSALLESIRAKKLSCLEEHLKKNPDNISREDVHKAVLSFGYLETVEEKVEEGFRKGMSVQDVIRYVDKVTGDNAINTNIEKQLKNPQTIKMLDNIINDHTVKKLTEIISEPAPQNNEEIAEATKQKMEKVHRLVYIGDFKPDAQKALMNAGYKEVKVKEGKLDELLEQVPMKKGPQGAVKKPAKKQPQL